MAVSGACLCGALRFESRRPPRRVTHCHCEMCRRASGAVVATFATFESEAVEWDGELQRYDSSDRGWRGFCPRCGSTVCFGFKPRPERIYVACGILDNPSAWPVGYHDCREHKVAWLHIDEDRPDAADCKPGS